MSRRAAWLAASCWAVGTWCAAGAVTSSAGSSVARLGVLPPVWVLAVLLGTAWVAVLAGRMSAETTRPLVLPLVATLPWLPLPLPAAALLWVGPLGLALSAAAALGSLALASRLRQGNGSSPKLDAKAETPPRRTTRGRIALVALVVLFALAAWRMAPVLPGGDEPHYLIITQSLLNDGDLRIEDNHRRREYLAYVNGELRPDYLRRGRDREIYSIHAPGVSALVLPAFALGGYPGAVLWLCVLSALGAAAVWRAARDVTGSADAAWVATAGVVLSAPFFLQAFTIYPDRPAAVIVAIVVWLALARRTPLDARTAAACGLLLAMLPWLHTRYAAIAGPLGLVVLARIVWPARDGAAVRPAPGSWPLASTIAFLLPAVVSGAAWLSYFAAIYGIWDPRAPYGHATEMRWARIPHGLAGLLLDQQFGLLLNAPVFLLALAGMRSLWRRSRRLTCELLVGTIPYVLAIAAFHMWWGGRSSPARFLVPVLLPLALPLASWWARHDSRLARAPGVLLLGASVAIAAALVWVDRGLLAYNSRDGHALWLLAAAKPVNLTFALPSLFQTGLAAAAWLAAAWTALAAGVWALLRYLDGQRWRIGTWTSAVGAAVVLYFTAGVSLGWSLSSHLGRDPGAGAAWVAAHACGGNSLVSVGAGGIRSVSIGSASLTIDDASRRPPRASGPVWAANDIPPGRYRLRFESALRVTGTAQVALGLPDATIARCALNDEAPDASRCDIVLPAGARTLFIDADAQLRRTTERISLEVEALGPEGDCDLRAWRVVASAAGVLYVLQGNAFVEPAGLWSAGGAAVTIVAPDPGAIRLRLRHGASAGTVTVRSGAWQAERQLGAGETWEVDVPRRATDPAPRIEVTTTAAFRPSDIDPGNGDHRLLGVWMELRE